MRVYIMCIYIYIWILHGFAHFDFGESWGSGSTPTKCAEVARSTSSTSSKLYQGNHQSGARCNKGCRWCNVILQVLLDDTALSCVANVACTVILLFKNHIYTHHVATAARRTCTSWRAVILVRPTSTKNLQLSLHLILSKLHRMTRMMRMRMGMRTRTRRIDADAGKVGFSTSKQTTGSM